MTRFIISLCIVAATLAVVNSNQCKNIEVRTPDCGRPTNLTVTTKEGGNASFVCYSLSRTNTIVTAPVFIVRKPNGVYYDIDEITSNRSDAIIETDLDPIEEGLCNHIEDCIDGNRVLFQYHYVRFTLVEIDTSFNWSLISCGYSTTSTQMNGFEVTEYVYYRDPFLLIIEAEAQAPIPSTTGSDPMIGGQNGTCNVADTYQAPFYGVLAGLILVILVSFVAIELMCLVLYYKTKRIKEATTTPTTDSTTTPIADSTATPTTDSTTTPIADSTATPITDSNQKQEEQNCKKQDPTN